MNHLKDFKTRSKQDGKRSTASMQHKSYNFLLIKWKKQQNVNTFNWLKQKSNKWIFFENVVSHFMLNYFCLENLVMAYIYRFRDRLHEYREVCELNIFQDYSEDLMSSLLSNIQLCLSSSVIIGPLALLESPMNLLFSMKVLWSYFYLSIHPSTCNSFLSVLVI